MFPTYSPQSQRLQAQALRVFDKTPSLRLRMLAGVPTGEWTRVEVALDVDAERIARLFLDTLGLTA